ncbi:MAG: T9SS type A sorting domain-containing protein [Chitinophagaceae bacterium]|nr:T9SS type A sorting domain-containing protein [Chitinophagaceae bacterium]
MKSPMLFRFIIFIVFFNPVKQLNSQVIDSTTLLFNIDTIAKNIGYPWEITYGPDDSLWITEARGYRVLRMSSTRTGLDKNDPAQQVLKIPLGTGEINFGRSIGTWPQGGMQGLAIHPEFYSGKPWVYLAYVFKTVGGTCPSNPGSPCYFRTKIVRCHFYFAGDAGSPAPLKDTLTIMDTVISNLPGSNDHNSGRMVIGPQPENGTYKLYYTIGDMGAGQFNNASRTNYAQNRDTCEGKILRFNTEPDADGVPGSPIHEFDKWRQWIPNDNPFTHSTIGGGNMRTPIYSYGHRNAQGIVWGNANGTWRLYSSEHGDKSDDEVNEITNGANYGWPKVAGMGSDNNYSSLDIYPNNDNLASLPVNYSENTWAITNGMQRPLFVTFNWGAAAIPSSASNIFTWGTIAPSSIDFYKGNIPGWKNSLLVTSLKYGMYRLKLKADGTYVDSLASANTVDTFPLLHGWRVRDVAIHPVANSGTFWVVMDSTGSTSGPTGGFGGGSSSTKDGGKVLKLTYKTLITLPLNNSSPVRPPVVKDLVQIFPNPVQSVINIHSKKELRKPLLVQICDIYGRLLKEEKSYKNDFSINVSSLTPGTYLLKLFNGYDMEVQIEKFIKE